MANEPGPTGYHTGTATIAQDDTLVTFQDAGNLFDIVKAGDDFGSHVGMPIRIKSLDRANSQITLAYKWPGPSQTAAPYEISFNPYILTYRQAVQTVLRLLKSGNVAALAGLTGATDTMPYFTGPGQMGRTGLTKLARTILGRTDAAGMRGVLDVAQQQQSLDDATSGRGMLVGAYGLGSTPLTATDSDLNVDFTKTGFYYLVGSGKTNAPSPTTQFLWHVEMVADRAYQESIPVGGTVIYSRYKFNGNWSNWTVSSVERGGNGNGQYIRQGGFQLCWQTLTLGAGNETWSTTSAGPYFGVNHSWTYPAIFSTTPVIVGSVSDGTRATSAQFSNAEPGRGGAGFHVLAMRNTNVSNLVVSLLAIGRS